MIQKAVRTIWRLLPGPVRLRLIRTTQPKFTVSVAAVIIDDDRRILLLNHVLRPAASWGLPGGFIDRSEQPEDAVRREIEEETGLGMKAVSMIRVRTVNRHIEILFRARPEGTAEVRSREIMEVGWFALEDLPTGVSRVQRMLIETVLNGEV